MKSIKKKFIEESNSFQSVFNERDILIQIRHPFLVSGLCSFQNEYEIFMVMDYVAGGDLDSELTKENCFSESRVRLYAAEIALGLGHLHNDGFIYRDLKPKNILFDIDGHIKITDFGFTIKANTATTFCGTNNYIAPEILLGKPYTKDVDWWSFGVIYDFFHLVFI